MTDLIAISSLGALGLIFGTYVFTSTILFYYPQVLHKKNPKQNKKSKFLVISHRGGAGENVENTITAFEHSKNLGVFAIEIDVHLTKDGHVVISHDNNLSRNAGVNQQISELEYHELPTLRTDLFVKSLDNDKCKENLSNINMENLPQSYRIPLLEEIFEKFPDLPINLDIKFHSDQLVEKVHELILKYKREDITVWGSFNENVTKKCNQLNPNIDLYFSLKGTVRFILLLITGLLPFLPIKETHFEMLVPSILLKNHEVSFGYRCALKILDLIVIRKSVVKHLQKRGLIVYFWVLNSDDEFEIAFNLGANGVITDFPSKLIKFLHKYPKCK